MVNYLLRMMKMLTAACFIILLDYDLHSIVTPGFRRLVVLGLMLVRVYAGAPLCSVDTLCYLLPVCLCELCHKYLI